MTNRFLVIAAVTLSLLPSILSLGVPTPIIDTSSAWKTHVFGCTVVPLVVDELNGPARSNSALMIVPAGEGFPPHRHLDGEEFLYFLGGEGEVTAWLPNTTHPVTHKVKTGSFHFLSAGGIHDFRNTGLDDLKILISQTPGPLNLEMFEAWPQTLNVPVGNVVHITDFIEVIAREKMAVAVQNGSCTAASSSPRRERATNFMARYWQQWSMPF